MNRAPRKSQFLGLLLATFALFSTSCQSLSLFAASRNQTQVAAATGVKLLVEESGIHAVSRQSLNRHGLLISDLKAVELNLSHNGRAIPFLIRDNQLIFYGQAPESRYTNFRPYLLEVGQQGLIVQSEKVPNLSAPLVNNVPQSIHLEENHIYTAEARKEDSHDVWFWHRLRQGEKFEASLDIPYLNETAAKIRVNSWGFTFNPGVEEDHDFELLVNNLPVANITWDGRVYHSSENILPTGTLLEGKNNITLDNSAEGASQLDIMHINWLELDYHAPAIAADDQLTFSAVDGLVQMSGFSDKPLVFDIADADNPQLLTGWEYDGQQLQLPVGSNMVIAAVGPDGYKNPTIEALREGHWRNNEHQADLIIITTDELAASLNPLIEAREEQGLNVVRVPIAEIYDEFGYGAKTPQSIRKFVAYAYQNWQEPRPRYLFLVGDATLDYRGYASDLPQNIVPSLVVPVEFSGETISDSRLADIDGDKRPDLSVGRWPVQTTKQVNDLVQRTLAYEEGHANQNALFVADGSEARFSAIMARLAESAQFPPGKILNLDSSPNLDLTKELNQGAWLATYIGHGSITRWGQDNILNLESIAGLTDSTPPIILQLTCLTGLFAHPQQNSLTEALLTHPRGPVLTVAATSLTLSNHQEPFAIQLLQKMQDPTIARIGDAFQEAKLSLDIENSNGLREINDTFALFGDPSTLLIRP